MALKRRRREKVVLVHFGEGTTSRGDVHEAMNWAAVMKLPVIFLCNNNGYAYSPRRTNSMQSKISRCGEQATACPAKRFDGNDVLAIYARVGQAIRASPNGCRPELYRV